MKLKSIEDVKNLKGKRVILRADFNVPIAKGKVVDDFRIQAVLPTIQMLKDAGAKVIILSHVEGKGGASLKPVANYFVNKKFPVTFIPKYFTASATKTLDKMNNGDVVLFENVRTNKGEKDNDDKFSKKLAEMGDLYVNDAFPVSHRAHASIVGIPKFLPSYMGPVFKREVKHLSTAFKPDRPFLFILGGAKFDTKMALLKKFMNLADFIFVGGALANNFFKELNMEIGDSVVSDGNYDLPQLLQTKKVFIPIDGSIQNGKKVTTKQVQDMVPKDKIWDAGPETLVQLKDLIDRSKFVLWNGPLGNYEEGFSEGTKNLAEIISKSNAKSVVGGGDTVAAIQELGLMDKFTFVSTGGGAMLDFLANETLPGIEAIEKSK
ncbi:MAG TPA: phosphoglycerate kinase [Candidatus Nanoarchaeia archaeon]|nr:phosphoglycerate kinase [Candidatus Nanoarchaeia archaeon]